MKTVIVFVFCFSMSVVDAGNSYFVSPSQPPFNALDDTVPPVAGQDFSLWVNIDCQYIGDILVDVDADVVRVFINEGPGPGCIDPPPPFLSPITTIPGLDEGSYSLVILYIPTGDVFPPVAADYPTYEIERSQFQVIGAGSPTAVNTMTNIGLILMMMLFLLGLKVNRMRYN